VNTPVDSKIEKTREPAEQAVVTDDERLRNRRKIEQAARDARDAIGQVIDKATRVTREIGKSNSR
jgi:hypothetical protein